MPGGSTGGVDPHFCLLQGPSSDVCTVCDGKVYLIEKHIEDGKIYHRSCFKTNNTGRRRSFVPPPVSKTSPPRSLSVEPAPKMRTNVSAPSLRQGAPPADMTDSRPEWQRRVNERKEKTTSTDKSKARHSIANFLNKSPEPAPMVELRTKPRANFRPVSSGVNTEDRIDKLRRIREQAKNNRESSPGIKERLEKLHNLHANNETAKIPASPSIPAISEEEATPPVSESTNETPREPSTAEVTASDTDNPQEMVTVSTIPQVTVNEVESSNDKTIADNELKTSNPFEEMEESSVDNLADQQNGHCKNEKMEDSQSDSNEDSVERQGNEKTLCETFASNTTEETSHNTVEEELEVETESESPENPCGEQDEANHYQEQDEAKPDADSTGNPFENDISEAKVTDQTHQKNNLKHDSATEISQKNESPAENAQKNDSITENIQKNDRGMDNIKKDNSAGCAETVQKNESLAETAQKNKSPTVNVQKIIKSTAAPVGQLESPLTGRWILVQFATLSLITPN